MAAFSVAGPASIKGELEEKFEKNAETSQFESTRQVDTHLKPKLFFWDNIIIYLASTILGLSVSNIIVDFVRPEPNMVVCYTPENVSLNQAVFINNYCYEYLPSSENFTLALVIHGAAMLVPYYLWKAYFSARIDFFFTHAAKLETLRNRNTGEYPHKNLSVVDYLHTEFYERKGILIGYIIKLATQLLFVLLSISISAGVFQDFDIEFKCPKEEDHHLFPQVTCAYAKLRFISILRWVDYAILIVSLCVLSFGLYWCLKHSHTELAYKNVAQFCYHSCMNSKFYKATRCYCLNNDQHFLIMLLYATDAGLGRVFRSVQIVTRIRHELDAHFESLDSYYSKRHLAQFQRMWILSCLVQLSCMVLNLCMSHLQNQIYIIKGDTETARENYILKALGDSKSFPKVMYEICKRIGKEQSSDYNNVSFDRAKMSAMDIACGYHSYLFAIASLQLQVVTIMLDSYYKNETEVFKCEEHSNLKIMRIPTNLFGLPSEHKKDFAKKIDLYTGVTSINPENTNNVAKFGLVVIGPLDDERKRYTVNQIIEMHSQTNDSQTNDYFEEGAVMLTVRPLEVQGKNVSGTFLEWKPETTEFWYESDSLRDIEKWLKQNEDVVSVSYFSDGYGEIKVKCGDQTCKFELKTYCHGEKRRLHK